VPVCTLPLSAPARSFLVPARAISVLGCDINIQPRWGQSCNMRAAALLLAAMVAGAAGHSRYGAPRQKGVTSLRSTIAIRSKSPAEIALPELHEPAWPSAEPRRPAGLETSPTGEMARVALHPGALWSHGMPRAALECAPAQYLDSTSVGWCAADDRNAAATVGPVAFGPIFEPRVDPNTVGKASLRRFKRCISRQFSPPGRIIAIETVFDFCADAMICEFIPPTAAKVAILDLNGDAGLLGKPSSSAFQRCKSWLNPSTGCFTMPDSMPACRSALGARR